MASAFFTGKGRFLVLFSLCTPHLPLSKRTLGPRLGVRKCVFQSLLWKFWPRDHGQILLLSDISFYSHKMRRTAEVADVLALHFSGFRMLWTRMTNLCFLTPLSSTLVCVDSDASLGCARHWKGGKFFFFFFVCAVYQTTLMWWTTGSGDTAHSVLFNILPERKEEMDLLTCDFDSGLCIRPIIMWND